MPAAAIIITVRAFVRLPSGGCPCFSRCGRPPLFLPVPFCMPFYIILSAAVLGGLLCSFLLLLEVFLIRLIGICARFGAGSGSHFWVVPPFCLRISFNLFFLACKRKLPFSIILRTLGRRVKRAGAAYTVLTILTVPIIFFVALGCRRKSPHYQGFRRFCACFFVVFWYTIIARSVHNYRTCGIQNLHGKYTKIARPVMAVYLRL